MSEDGFSDSYEEPNMEIQIKTLMGTTFDIKVSSNDTVGDIKKKIYRVEGVPVYQQNLIFHSEELKDTNRLCDSGIKNGSTLTLVSAMRGGPISTRRLSVTCEHHMMLKDLKDLLENTRDEITPGSKVSVLVFKEGDIINLLRVIENEDGSYSPYSENPISPPSKPSRKDTQLGAFERMVEDTEMCSKMTSLRKKMAELNEKRQNKHPKPSEDRECGVNVAPKPDSDINLDDIGNSAIADDDSLSFKFLEECATELLDKVDLTIFERSLDEGNQSENEEIALKDKHRTKPKTLQSLPLPKTNSKSLYSERKGAYSHTKQNYARIAKRRDSRLFERRERVDSGTNSYTSYSRDRNNDTDWEKSSYLDGSSYSNMLTSNISNRLSRSSILDADISSRLSNSCILPNSSLLESNIKSRLSLPSRLDNTNENPFLLEGINSNRLPDLNILEKPDPLMSRLEHIGDTSSILDKNSSLKSKRDSIGDTSNIIDINSSLMSRRGSIGDKSSIVESNSLIRLPISSRVGNGSEKESILKSNGLNRLSNSSRRESSFTSLTNRLDNINSKPNILENTASILESRLSNSISVAGKVRQSCNYSLSNSNKLSKTSSLESTSFPSLNRVDSLTSKANSRTGSPILRGGGASVEGPSVEEMGAKLAEHLQLLDDKTDDLYGESVSVSARNRVHLTRLVLSSEGAERPKSSPDSIELEEHAQDLWEIREPASERLKHSATCKVGLLKRRQGLEYNYDSLENPPTSNLKPELGNLGNYSKTSTEFGVCSGTNFYMPQYLSAPSAIPPQYAPKQQNYCDLYFRNEPRSPLYSRRNKKDNLDDVDVKQQEKYSPSFLTDCSSIQRLKNDDNLFGPRDELVDDLCGFYNLGCAAHLFEKNEERKEEIKLPPVIKKKSRCSECSKKLNITNIYSCRCGRIFCSQHRYSEVHRCTYDYKTEGRKILERQNPLVTAEKVKRF